MGRNGQDPTSELYHKDSMGRLPLALRKHQAGEMRVVTVCHCVGKPVVMLVA